MRHLILFISLLSFNCLAQQEVNVSYLKVHQNLYFNPDIKFSMNAAQLSYTYWSDYNIGIRLAVAKSTETVSRSANTQQYSNEMDGMWKGQLTYRYYVTDNSNIIAGVGLTEYNTTWKINGVEPAWSKDTDSHKPSWFIGYQYKIFDSLLFESVYGYEYDKQKENFGAEKTDSLSIGLTYIF